MLNVRAITQFLIGLMLLFGAATIMPRSLILLKGKHYGRGLLYLILGSLSLFLTIVAFAMAFD
ncbi:hypothetical protein BMS3Bbin05_00836 [bacterium BMS3Bbin05]|nr:hypothetical protein BMS3Bbin05_00836 [bacterium BMS3Bbin05]HDL20567.1 hypothetical protein [Nitrospirota bacterium]